jgi:hypothetical protein
MKELVFGITVFDEPPAQLAWCLDNLRRAYARSLVFVIDDGGRGPEYVEVCRQFCADFKGGQRLKQIGRGCQWWHRFFDTALRFEWDYCFKMDPDTCMHRPFGELPRNLDVFGTLTRPCDIQGGLQGFSRRAVRLIMKSGACLDPIYADLGAWGNRRTRGYTRSTGQISTDHSLAHIVRRLRLPCGNWPDVDCQWRRRRPFRTGVAATHPHKLKCRGPMA